MSVTYQRYTTHPPTLSKLDLEFKDVVVYYFLPKLFGVLIIPPIPLFIIQGLFPSDFIIASTFQRPIIVLNSGFVFFKISNYTITDPLALPVQN